MKKWRNRFNSWFETEMVTKQQVLPAYGYKTTGTSGLVCSVPALQSSGPLLMSSVHEHPGRRQNARRLYRKKDFGRALKARVQKTCTSAKVTAKKTTKSRVQ